jgi:hypothetical protein
MLKPEKLKQVAHDRPRESVLSWLTGCYLKYIFSNAREGRGNRQDAESLKEIVFAREK